MATKKNAFGYPESLDEEIGIYIVCNDANLLLTINQMMRKKGLLAISDTAGRQHYIIDARKSPSMAAWNLNELMFSEDPSIGLAGKIEEARLIDTAIEIVLKKHDFDMSLIGTSLLKHILKAVYKRGLSLQIKKIYSDIGIMYHMTGMQVDRNVRYALSKSDLVTDRMKCAQAYIHMAEEIRVAIETGKAEKVYKKNEKKMKEALNQAKTKGCQ